MVAVGGFGVLAILVFVAAVAFGTRPVAPAPGDRLAVSRSPSSEELLVAVARCPVERVTSVAVSEPDGAIRWRITSAKGSIDERYTVGAPAPTGFDTDVALEGRVEGEPLELEVVIDREGTPIVDRVAVPALGPDAGSWLHQGVGVSEGTFEGRSTAAADCPGEGGDRAVVVWLFGVAALIVLVTFGGMVRRWWGGRPDAGR